MLLPFVSSSFTFILFFSSHSPKKKVGCSSTHLMNVCMYITYLLTLFFERMVLCSLNQPKKRAMMTMIIQKNLKSNGNTVVLPRKKVFLWVDDGDDHSLVLCCCCCCYYDYRFTFNLYTSAFAFDTLFYMHIIMMIITIMMMTAGAAASFETRRTRRNREKKS